MVAQGLYRDPVLGCRTCRLLPPIDEAQLPGALIERLAGDAQDRLIGLLRFLSPVTGGAGMRAF